MRVLFISYYFPPDVEIGAVRPYHFARLLPEHGIEPWIVTLRQEFIERSDSAPTVEGVPSERIIRTVTTPTRRVQLIQQASALKNKLRQPSAAGLVASDTADTTAPGPTAGEAGFLYATPRRRWLLEWLRFPDDHAGWEKPALAAARKLLRENKFDAIFSTSPPRTAHFIGAKLAKEFNLPWIMDLRDPWFKDVDEIGSKALDNAYQRLFVRCARQANRIILNTTRLQHQVERDLPFTKGKALAIPNGCNPASIANFSATHPTEFRIGHYGSVYSKRDAGIFLRALRQWIDRRAQNGLETPVKVRFVGPEFGHTPEQIAELNLGNIVTLAPAVSRDEVRAMMREDYALLLLANKQPLQIPGKLFEYLAARRRMIATVDPEGATRDLLTKAPGSFTATSEAEIVAALDDFWSHFEAGDEADISYEELLDECSYASRTRLLAEVFREITAK